MWGTTGADASVNGTALALPPCACLIDSCMLRCSRSLAMSSKGKAKDKAGVGEQVLPHGPHMLVVHL